MFPLNPKRYTLNAREAFSLVEVLVVIAVMGILTVSIVGFSSTTRSQNALLIEAAKLVETINQARSLAISTFDQDDPPPPCAYGVEIRYVASNFGYQIIKYDRVVVVPGLEPTCPKIGYLPSGDDIYDPGRKIILDNSVAKLDSSLVFDTNNNPLRIILFTPPEPKTWLYRSGSGFGGSWKLIQDSGGNPEPQRAIRLCIKGVAGVPKAGVAIKMNRAGQITTQNITCTI